jgi:LysR family cys regulon transcriptional activator
MKTYVASGLGIGIVAHTAYDQQRDNGLCAIDARELFRSNMIHIGIRRESHLSRHALNLIRLFAPQLVKHLAPFGMTARPSQRGAGK